MRRPSPRQFSVVSGATVMITGIWLSTFTPVNHRLARSSLASPLVGVLDGLGDVIVGGLTELLRVLFTPVEALIENHADALLRLIVSTPHPESVFGTPTNGAWPELHSYYWETIIPISLGLYALAIGLVILLETTSHLFSSYHRTKLKQRAFSGLVGLLAWWWIAALSLELVDQLAITLLPSLGDVSFFETLSFSAMGVLGLVITMLLDLIIFVLIGLVYFTRHLALYLFVLLMPLLIVIWIPGVGPFSLVSGFARNLASFYVPFLFMSVPVALLLRVGGLLGQTASFSMTGVGGWIAALVVPFAALISPFVLFSQVGQIQSVTARMSSGLSQSTGATRTKGAQRQTFEAKDRADKISSKFLNDDSSMAESSVDQQSRTTGAPVGEQSSDRKRITDLMTRVGTPSDDGARSSAELPTGSLPSDGTDGETGVASSVSDGSPESATSGDST